MDITRLISILIYFSLFTTKIYCQIGSIPIKLASNTAPIVVEKAFNKISQIKQGNAVWTTDGEKASIKIDSGQVSNTIIFEDLHLNLNPVRKIRSIKLLIDNSITENSLKSMNLTLLDSNYMIYSKSINLTNSNFNEIRLGINEAVVGWIKSKNLSVSFRFKNGIKKTEININQVSIIIDYYPIFRACSSDILTFYIDPLGVNYNYKWSTPKGARMTSDNNMDIVNVVFEDNDFGKKNIEVVCTNSTDTLVGSLDFYYVDCRTSTISGSVLTDINCNDRIDRFDMGFESIGVGLYMGLKLEKTVKTDSSGRFVFDNLESGYYNIKIQNTGGLVLDKSYNSQSKYKLKRKVGQFTTDEFFVEPAMLLDSIDFLFEQKFDYSLYLWEDMDSNRILDQGEINDSMEYSTLQLNGYKNVNYNKGKYKFINLSRGSSVLCIGQDEDIYFADSENGFCTKFEINCGDTSRNIEIFRKGSISGEIWLDSDEDGIKEQEERKLVGKRIVLLDSLDNVLDTAICDSKGKFEFYHLLIGTYRLKLIDRDSFDITVYNDTNDNDFYNENGSFVSGNIIVTSGAHIEDIDCGLKYKRCSVGDYIWFDSNENGIQDSEENGVDGIEIRLYSELGFIEKTISYTGNGRKGYYKFDSLRRGNYYIELVIPNKFNLTKPGIGDNESDSDIFEDNKTVLFHLAPGDKKEDIDAGLILNYSSISIETWIDKIGNAVKDTYDKGLDSIRFDLFDKNDIFIKLGLSVKKYGVSGICDFDSIPAGEYYFKIAELDNKYRIVQPNIGNDRAVDSDFYSENGEYRTSVFKLKGGMSIDSIDVGVELNYAKISGLVWDDIDEDGIKEPDENGIGEVRVELYDENGRIIASTLTNSDISLGQYSFDRLERGEYYLKFILEKDLDYSQGTGSDMNISGDFGLGTTGLILLDWGENITDIDAGFVSKTSKIGDFIWLDINENGIQDDSEKGVSDVLVFLLNNDSEIIDSTVSNADGKYYFSALEEGRYKLEAKIDKKYNFTLFDKSPDFGSKITDEEGFTEFFEIVKAKDRFDLDIGIVYDYSSIGDRVWLDKNGNGAYDNGDLGLKDIKLYLIDEYGVDTIVAITDENGYYNYDKIISGNYYIRLEIPDTLEAIHNAFDYPITGKNGNNTTDIFTISPGKNNTNFDFGLKVKKASIGDYVWFDSNENGLQDLDEKGINGIVVRLFSDMGEQVGITVSGENENRDGYYNFEVSRGVYFLQFIVADSLEATDIISENTVKNSDVTGQVDINSTDFFRVKSGRILDDIDAGFKLKKSTIGGKFWFDNNGDGIIQKDEGGVNGAKVSLYNENGLVANTTTYTSNIGSGFYIFKDIEKGDYYLRFEYQDQYINTIPLNQIDKKNSSYVTNANGDGTTDYFYLKPGSVNLYINGGFTFKTENLIGDFVWLDENENGIQDKDETGLNDIKVGLYSAKDRSLVRTVKTGNFPGSEKKGYYDFRAVQEGDYYVKFFTKIGQKFTAYNKTDKYNDSDVMLPSGETDTFHISKLDRLNYIDAGIVFVTHGSIGDQVWEDMNGNNIQDDGEPGINGIKIRLYRTSDNKLQDTQISRYDEESNKDGYYLFENLANREYYVKIEKPDSFILVRSGVGDEDELDSDIESLVTLSTGNIKLKFQEKRTDIDIGLNKFAELGDYIWIDENKNGVQDDEEGGIENVHLSLLEQPGNNNNKYSTYSDENGNYSFKRIQPGNYYMKVDLPAGYTFTKTGVGNKTNDSDVNQNGESIIFNIVSGSRNKDIDIGLVHNDELRLTAFPNPAKKEISLFLELDESGKEIKLFVSTMKGEIVKSVSYDSVKNLNNFKINIEDLKPGYYNIVIFIDGKVITGKRFLKSE